MGRVGVATLCFIRRFTSAKVGTTTASMKTLLRLMGDGISASLTEVPAETIALRGVVFVDGGDSLIPEHKVASTNRSSSELSLPGDRVTPFENKTNPESVFCFFCDASSSCPGHGRLPKLEDLAHIDEIMAIRSATDVILAKGDSFSLLADLWDTLDEFSERTRGVRLGVIGVRWEADGSGDVGGGRIEESEYTDELEGLWGRTGVDGRTAAFVGVEFRLDAVEGWKAEKTSIVAASCEEIVSKAGPRVPNVGFAG
jgi:hypothetical protein